MSNYYFKVAKLNACVLLLFINLKAAFPNLNFGPAIFLMAGDFSAVLTAP